MHQNPEFHAGAFSRAIPAFGFVEIGRRTAMEILGEALGLASRKDPAVEDLIPGIPRIVALRNRIIHGYDSVDPELVWDLVETKVPSLLAH